jgi:hypothetical protein
MTATYTFDIFSTLDGFANHDGDWGGYWGKQGPEFLAHRAAAYRDPMHMVLGATTYTSNAPFLSEGFDRTLLNAGLIDTIEVTVFPVISGKTGVDRIFDGTDDFDLELLQAHTFDDHTQVLTYRPTRHG